MGSGEHQTVGKLKTTVFGVMNNVLHQRLVLLMDPTHIQGCFF